MKKCEGSAESNRRTIAAYNDAAIMRGVSKHADPAWWKTPTATSCNQAYLRRWGSMLRREARQRGLL